MRRTSLITLMAAALTLSVAAAVPAQAADPQGHREGPPTVTGDDVQFTPQRTLSSGSPEEAGLVAKHVDQIVSDLTAYLGTTPENPTFPMYGGAVVLAAKDGVIVEHAAVGHALRYASADGTELPPDEWIPMQEDTIFDLASVSKLFCTVVVLQLVEQDLIDLDAPVARYIPEFAQNGKEEVTVKQLLTHTSGLRAWRPLYSLYPTPQERIAAIYADDLANPPGTRYVYSDLGLITLGKLAERVTGKPLDQLVAERITDPLGMTDTMYNPPESLRHRIAATEDMPWTSRGIVWGEVHDENAWSLGGVAGHAGLFSTAADLAVFSQMLLNGGRYGKERILSEETVRQAITNQNVGIPPTIASRRGLGFELHQPFYMASLDSPVTFGHTGFTGTSIVIDPLSRSLAILLTNRVHPNRNWGSNNPSRQAVTRNLGLAIPVRPAVGETAWFSNQPHSTTHTLTAPLARPAEDDAQLAFRLWYDTEEGWDTGRLEASTDGGASWALVPVDWRSATTAGLPMAPSPASRGVSGSAWMQNCQPARHTCAGATPANAAPPLAGGACTWTVCLRRTPMACCSMVSGRQTLGAS